MSTSSKYVVNIERGETLQFDVTLLDPNDQPVDLTGYKARLHVRPYASWLGTTGTPELAFTTENGKLVLTPLEGRVTVKISSDDAEVLNADNVRKAKWAFGLEAYLDSVSPNVVLKMIKRGTINVSGTRVY